MGSCENRYHWRGKKEKKGGERGGRRRREKEEEEEEEEKEEEEEEGEEEEERRKYKERRVENKEETKEQRKEKLIEKGDIHYVCVHASNRFVLQVVYSLIPVLSLCSQHESYADRGRKQLYLWLDIRGKVGRCAGLSDVFHDSLLNKLIQLTDSLWAVPEIKCNNY